MASEIKCNVATIREQKKTMETALAKYKEARAKVQSEIKKVKGDSKGTAMQKLYDAFIEFDNEYEDMDDVIATYLSQMEKFCSDLEAEDKKYKGKINSIG